MIHALCFKKLQRSIFINLLAISCNQIETGIMMFRINYLNIYLFMNNTG